jgi:hypothetical protein
LRAQRDRSSAQGDPQSRLTAASLASLAKNKLPLSLLCLLVSQPTHLGERLHLARCLFARAQLYLFVVCSRVERSACALRSANSGGAPPKFIARSTAIPLRTKVLNFLDPKAWLLAQPTGGSVQAEIGYCSVSGGF